MPNHNVNNLRQVLADYPKLWEWEARFIGLPGPVMDILGDQTVVDSAGAPVALLTLLMDTNKIPALSVGLIEDVFYKGAKAVYGSRIKLDGNLENIAFKEIKGTNAASSWLVRRAMKAWCHTIDDYFGEQEALQVPDYKAILELSMQNETGQSFYKIRYFGVKPSALLLQALAYLPANTYPRCMMNFTYDYWRDQYDEDFGQGA